jgi:hypothetical protein
MAPEETKASRIPRTVMTIGIGIKGNVTEVKDADGKPVRKESADKRARLLKNIHLKKSIVHSIVAYKQNPNCVTYTSYGSSWTVCYPSK